MKFRNTLLVFFLACTLLSPSSADVIVNWENGFELELPSTWLRQEGGGEGVKLASDDVKLNIEPFAGVTMKHQIERLHAETKKDGFGFKKERTFTLHEVPAQEMIFYKNGRYKFYYVLMAGARGFLLTLTSDSTDSEAFLEAQDIVMGFRVLPPDQVQQR